MQEQWRDIAGYEGRYQVSDQGRVRRTACEITQGNGHSEITYSIPPRLLRSFESNCSYQRIGLRMNGQRKYYNVHRLVAQAFVPNPSNLPEVNHKNEDKSDNRAENLEWVTSEQNCNHGTRNKRISDNTSRSRRVLRMTQCGSEVKEYKSISAASRETGISVASIGGVCRGEHHTAGGYKWQYK